MPGHMLKSTLLLVILLWNVPAQAQGRFQYEDVFSLEYASDPQLAPDGKALVYVRNSMDIMSDRRQTRLWLADWTGAEHRALTGLELQESAPVWSPNGDRIAFRGNSGQGTQIYIHWLASAKTKRVTQLQRSPGNPAWSPDGQWLAFTMLVPDPEHPLQAVELPAKPNGAEWADPPRVITRFKNRADGVGLLEPGYRQIFILPAEGGTPIQLTKGPYDHGQTLVWTPNGKRLIFSGNRNSDWEREFRNSEIYSISLEDRAVTALTDRDGPDHSPAISPDGTRIAYLGYDDHIQTYQVTRLYLMGSDGGSKRVLLPGLDRDIRNPTWDDSGSGLYFAYDDRGDSKLAYTDLNGQVRDLASGLGGTSLGRPYGGGSFSTGPEGRFALTVTTPSRPAEVAVGRRTPAPPDVRTVTDLNRDLLAQRTLAQIEEIEFASSFDNRPIQGWILKPPGFDPDQVYPLLLEIHGGPIANYGPRFAAELQLYAAAGYVVLYANPRGSTGYGEEFGNLLHHDYPGHDYDDLISGVDAVIARGYIDPERLYVTGGSAGGIMTAWIVGKTDRFRAAAVVKPVVNWTSKVLTADNYYAYHNYRYPGSPWENPAVYLKYSPISLVGNVATPTLLMGGEADLRTPISEAEQFFHALMLRGVETQLVRLPGASHNIARRPSQLIAKVAHILAWFERFSSPLK